MRLWFVRAAQDEIRTGHALGAKRIEGGVRMNGSQHIEQEMTFRIVQPDIAGYDGLDPHLRS